VIYLTANFTLTLSNHDDNEVFVKLHADS